MTNSVTSEIKGTYDSELIWQYTDSLVQRTNKMAHHLLKMRNKRALNELIHCYSLILNISSLMVDGKLPLVCRHDVDDLMKSVRIEA